MKYCLDTLIPLQLERENEQRELGMLSFRKQLEQRKTGKDYSRSKAGKVFTDSFLGVLVKEVENAIEDTLRGARTNGAEIGKVYGSLKVIEKYDLETGAKTGEIINIWSHEQAALIALRTMLDTVALPLSTTEERSRGKRWGGRPDLYKLHSEVGRRLQMQLILNLGRAYFPDSEYRSGFITRMLKEAYKETANAKHKDTTTRLKLSELADWYEDQGKGVFAEIFRWTPWPNKFSRKIGAKLVSIIQYGLHICEDVRVFKEQKSGDGKIYLALSDSGQELAEQIDNAAAQQSYWDLPMLCPPKPHTHERRGGYLNIQEARASRPACGKHKGYQQLSMIHLRFLNTQANVPLRINNSILNVMEGIYRLKGNARNVGKFIPLPYIDDHVIQLSDYQKSLPSQAPEKKAMKQACKATHIAFKELESQSKELRTEDLLKVARLCKADEQFWLPTSGDFRGRTYTTAPLLSYQQTDPAKALIEFAEPVQVDKRTKFWMEIDLSGNMGFDKHTWEDRQEFVQSNLEHIVRSVRHPLDECYWQRQDKPWQFLAVAIEYVRLFVDNDPNRHTHCRTSIDATCSGQQLMAGLTRSLATAVQVNLVPADKPADVYSNVVRVAADRLKEASLRVQHFPNGRKKPGEPIDRKKLLDLTSTASDDLVKSRKGGKAIVMVAQYGAGRDRRIEELALKCRLKSGEVTLSESRALYPFFDAGLSKCLEALDPFLAWAQKVAKAAFIDEHGNPRIDPTTGKPKIALVIPSPDGSVTIQTYRIMNESQKITLDHLGSYFIRGKRRWEKDMQPTELPDISKHISSTAANLVHACDGAVLALALGDANLPFTTTHDSISGRPSQEMDQLLCRLKRSYCNVFNSGILRRFVEVNGLCWDEYNAPNFETYDPALVLKADYTFC